MSIIFRGAVQKMNYVAYLRHAMYYCITLFYRALIPSGIVVARIFNRSTYILFLRNIEKNSFLRDLRVKLRETPW